MITSEIFNALMGDDLKLVLSSSDIFFIDSFNCNLKLLYMNITGPPVVLAFQETVAGILKDVISLLLFT